MEVTRVSRPSAETGDAGDRNKSIRVVERTFAVLEAVGSSNDGVTAAQVQERTRLPTVTTYRLLRVLQQLGYAEQDVDSGRWHVGLKVLDLRGQVGAAAQLAALARPYLKEMMLASGGLAHLALLRQGDVIYLDTVRDLDSLDTYVPPGHRMPAHCVALGKALLAELSDEQLARFAAEQTLPARAERTITTANGLLRAAARIRADGYAVEADEAAPDSRSFAAPVRDYTTRAVAAVAVSGDTARFPDERHQELAALVVDTARRLSARLGFQPWTALDVAAG
jgi:IclR family acetate operon transcriptional repressor